MKKIKIICDLNQISMLRLILLLPSITIIVSSSRIVILLISVLIIRFASFTDLIRFVPSNSSIRMILYLSIRFVPSISFRIILPFISSIRIILYNISILFVRFSYSLRTYDYHQLAGVAIVTYSNSVCTYYYLCLQEYSTAIFLNTFVPLIRYAFLFLLVEVVVLVIYSHSYQQYLHIRYIFV